MDKYPWIQFYPNDWLADPKLTMCSATTRGIWMDMVCNMHKLDRCGQITGTIEQLSRICRCTAVELQNAINELHQTNTAIVTKRNISAPDRLDAKIHNDQTPVCNGVTNCNDSVTVLVTVISKRMKRENAGRERVRKHRKKTSDVTDKKRSCNETVLHNNTEHIIQNTKHIVSNHNVSGSKECIVALTNDTLVQKSKKTDLLHSFERFWDMYDKKINRSKCKKRWKRIKSSEKAEIFKTLPAYLQSTPDKQFRKHPLTYLNNEGWRDDVIEKKSKVRGNMERIMSMELR